MWSVFRPVVVVVQNWKLMAVIIGIGGLLNKAGLIALAEKIAAFLSAGGV